VRLPVSAGVCVEMPWDGLFLPLMLLIFSTFATIHLTNKPRVLYLFGAVAWSLWLIRNEFVFQNIVIHSPNVGIFRAISFLQKWRVMNKETEQLWTDTVIQKLNLQLSSLRPEEQGTSSVTPTVT
jgi:hypothetical protein